MNLKIEQLIKLDPADLIEKLEDLFQQGLYREIYEICTKLTLEDKTEFDYYIRALQLDVMYILSMSEEAIDFGYQLLDKSNLQKMQYRKLGVMTEIFMMTHWKARREESKVLRDKCSSIIDDLVQNLDDSQYPLLNARTLIHYAIFETMLLKDVNDIKGFMRIYAWANEIGKKYDLVTQLVFLKGILSHYLQNNSRYREAMKVTKEMFELNTSEISKARNLFTLASIHAQLGEFETALEKFRLSLDHFKDLPLPNREVAMTYNSIGFALLRLNRNEEAKSWTIKSFDMMKELGHTKEYMSYYSNLISCELALNNRMNARDYFEEYMSLYKALDEADKIPDNYKVRHLLLQGFYYSRSKMIADKLKGKKLLKGFVKEPPQSASYSDILSAYKTLCFLLLAEVIELLNTHEEFLPEEIELVKELSDYSTKLEEIAIAYNIKSEQIQIHVFRAYINLMYFNMEKVNYHMKQAVSLSKEYNLLTAWVTDHQVDSLKIIKETDSEFQINKNMLSYDFHNSINEIIHSVPRLQILLYLVNNHKAAFTELADALDFTPGKLNKHLKKLEEVGYVDKFKEFTETKFLAYFSLTPEGILEFKSYSSLLTTFLND